MHIKFMLCNAKGCLFTLLLLSGLIPLSGYAGIMVGGTRFIYEEKNDKGLSILVRNTDDTPYLIQSRIMPDHTPGNIVQSVPENAFIATPPLMPLKGKHENYLRIIHNDEKLPADRESLFQLSIASIPSGRPDNNDLQIAVRSRFKFIYRPSGLEGAPNTALQQLRWKRHGQVVQVENPTPYYVTLYNMVINGKTQPAQGVVPPFSTRTETWCPKNGACRFQWQGLDDSGFPTTTWSITPQAKGQTGKAL